MIGGYLCLFCIWLLFTPDLNAPPDEGLLAEVYRLADDLGRVPILAVLSVTAYLIGSVAYDVMDLLTLHWRDERWRSWHVAPAQHAAEFRDQLQGIGIRDDAARNLARYYRLTEDDPEARQILLEAVSVAVRGNLRELALPASLLIANNPLVFSEVDRLKSEGELRMAVGGPLFALGVILSFKASLWWLLLLPVALLVAGQGVVREGDARITMHNARAAGQFESPAHQRFWGQIEELEKQYGYLNWTEEHSSTVVDLPRSATRTKVDGQSQPEP